ncbi:hypothetical protein KV605_33845 [Rhodococcus opacus]|nr:hypothetical protein [Rhodococcus opacus]
MLARVSVYLLEGHEVGEERIPALWKVHAAAQYGVRFLRQGALQLGDDAVTLAAHPAAVEHGRCHARSEVVDLVEHRGGCVEGPREPPADPVGQAGEHPDQHQQSTHHHVAEHHVEQQLFVGPAGAVRAAVQILPGGAVEECACTDRRARSRSAAISMRSIRGCSV